MATKLKDAKLTSVDFVESGANQDAHFKLLKARDTKGKSFWELFKAFLKGQSAYSEEELQKAWCEEAQGAFLEESQAYTTVLKKSLDSILSNESLDQEDKYAMMQKSLNEFNQTIEASMEEWRNLNMSMGDITKAIQKEGEEEMKIDKSKLTAEELKQYEALAEKAKAEEDNEKKPDKEETPSPNKEKEKTHPQKEKTSEADPPVDEPKDDEDVDKECKNKVNKALEEEFAALKKNMEQLQKSTDMEEMRKIAKKYTLLGKKEEELADTLYQMKKSGQGTYDQYIALLDENLSMVEKGGMFAEIGKSGNSGAYVGSDVESKIQAAAAKIRKSNAELSEFDAIEKAWETHPELAVEYEKTYIERR
ncbi:hypothetical protein OBO34_19535 [Clostridiales Family XIII bacterium ASD5510]|uniref:Uncharacterized protein n=1 Tax=Hominibacterium faecale TaxID=2839743 RepID=A0A9J6QYF0_9FIRM|nr:hypothetical protein [Hominibacterium faecale]MCU7380508.1 hypothetical protein [Hominibacterium faecale]